MSSAAYNYLGQSAIYSELITPLDIDSFFNPVTNNHTGFAHDGFYYAAGVVNTSQVSSWFTETPSGTRGLSAAFPAQALVLVNRASLVILDATNPALNLWMLFYLEDTFGFPNNFLNGTNSVTPSDITWANGVLTITSPADAGATVQAPNMLTIDFTRDQIYIDSPVTTPPYGTGIANPVTVPSGQSVAWASPGKVSVVTTPTNQPGPVAFASLNSGVMSDNFAGPSTTPASITWSQFMLPNLPLGSVIDAIYPVVDLWVNGAGAVQLTVPFTGFNPGSPTSGQYANASIGTTASAASSYSATFTIAESTGLGPIPPQSLLINFIGLAVYYTPAT
jgi:hypothetical protein